MNTSNYSFSKVKTTGQTPPKIRNRRESALAAQMNKVFTKPNTAFQIDNKSLKECAPNVYATARRIGKKVSLRTVEGGVEVWFEGNLDTNTKTDATKKANTNKPAAADGTKVKRGPGRPRKDQSLQQAA